MAYPSDLPTVTVRHRIVGTDGTPARGGGRVTAVLTGRLWTGQGSVVPTQYTATVQEDGTYELHLPPVDHPDIVAGRGEAYLVTEPAATIDTRRPGRVATEQFHVAPVTEMVGQTVDVSDVLVNKPKPGGGVERITITGPATDESLAGIIADPSSQTAASLKDTIGAEVGEVVNDPEAPFRRAVGGEIDAAMYEKAPVALSANLADDRDLIPGYPSTVHGGIIETTYNSTTALLPVTPGGTYTSRGLTRRAFYAADGSFIEATEQTQTATVTWTAPPNARFVRYTANNTYWPSQAQVNAGSTLAPFENFRAYVPGDQVANLPTDALADDAVTVPKTQFIHPSTNLFNEELRTLDLIFASGAATPTYSATYDISDWIAVTPGQQYNLRDVLRVAWFNGRRQHISTISAGSTVFEPSGTVLTAPTGARWARLSVAKNFVGVSARMAVGTEALPYEPGGGTLAGYVRVPGVDTSTPNPAVLSAPASGQIAAAAPYPDMYTEVMASTPASFHGLYDALAAAHPGYITRTELGTEASADAHPIYQYVFDPGYPEHAGTNVVPVPKPTLIVLTGTHGSEKAAAYAAYHLMERICNGHTDDQMLGLLRTEVRFVVVPIVNPYGFAQHQRGNSAGVDVNRNFPEAWVQGEPGTPTYGGTAPLSEPEAQAVDTVLRAYPDALAAIDFHNFTTAPVPYRFLWATSRVPAFNNIGSALIRRVDRMWKPRYPFMDPDPDVHIGYVTQSNTGGTLGRYAADVLGHVAGTFEICERVNAKDSPTNFDSDAMTMGYEAWANYVTLLVDNLA